MTGARAPDDAALASRLPGLGARIGARFFARRYLIAVCLLTVAYLAARGIDPSATYPLGDGGLFYDFCESILANHLHVPAVISFAGASLPLAYSHLAFICVAALTKFSGLPLGTVMNLWVGLWCTFVPVAVFTAARSLGSSPRAALYATAFVSLANVNMAWVGMGGGMTRAPGLVLYLLSCGALARYLRRADSAGLAVLLVCTALDVHVHMEFGALLGISALPIAYLSGAPRARACGAIAIVWATCATWLIGNDLVATLHALRTSHVGVVSDVFGETANIAGLRGNGVWAQLAGTVAFFWLTGRRRILGLWWLFLVVADSRQGILAALLPAALAVGDVAERIGCATVTHARVRTAATALALGCAAFSVASANAGQFVRLSSGDVAEMRRIDALVPTDGAVVTISPEYANGEGVDFSDEWLPALTHRANPFVWEGFEWGDRAAYLRRVTLAFDLRYRCIAIGPACVRDTLASASIAPSRSLSLFIPHHGRAYPAVIASYRADPAFRLVDLSEGGAVFRFRGRSSEGGAPSR